MSDYESASSDADFEDYQSDEEPQQVLPQSQEKTTGEQAVPNSVYPPLSSICTEPVLSSESMYGYFVDLDPEDTVDQTSNCLESALDDLDPPDTFDQTSISLESAVVDSDPEDTFSQPNIPLESAELRKISSLSKGLDMFKNQLQTWYLRSQSMNGIKVIKLPAYSHVKEGPDHVPVFKATVEVYGQRFQSNGYNNKVEAEQNAASVALNILCPCETPPGQPDVNSRFTAANSPFNTEPSNAYSSTGAISVPVTANLNGQRSTYDGLTVEAPINIRVDEESVGSSPPDLSSIIYTARSQTASSSTVYSARSQTVSSSTIYTARSQSAEGSYEQFWGAFSRQGTASREISTSSLRSKRPTSSRGGAATARLENFSQDIAVQFSGRQLTKSSLLSDFVKEAWEPQSLKWPPQTEHLKALGMLDFSTHAFPILTRLNGRPLEEVFSVHSIEGLQEIPADEVNRYLWSLDGQHNGQITAGQGYLYPERLLYDCVIHPGGKLHFRVTENKQGSTTLLQRKMSFDKVLRVFLKGTTSHFPEHGSHAHYFKNGIFVGHRLYQYYVHKVADKDELAEEEQRNDEGTVRCYFVCTDSRGDRDMKDKDFMRFSTIAQARYMLAHVHTCSTVATSNVRMQLCLSKTMTIEGISLSDVIIQELEDLPSKDTANPKASFTDGTGFISTDLARLMPPSIYKGKEGDQEKEDFCEEYPSVIQVRFFQNGSAYKGTLLANKKLPQKTIQCYKSMKKVQSDPSISEFSISSFELVWSSPSRPPKCAKLSQDLILLLSIGGVKESVFLEALKDATEDLRLILCDRKRAYEEFRAWKTEMDLVQTTLQMLRAGILMKEPGLQDNLRNLLTLMNKFDDFKKGKVPLDDTFYLVGTADPTGTLKPNEVVILRSDGSIYGWVLVYRAPGKHPGDIHKVRAVKCQALEDMVGGGKNVIFFSTQGTRPLVHEIANGDFDGDSYWICHNKKVVEQFTEWPSRWTPGPVNSKPDNGQKPIVEISPAKLHEALVEEYFNERFHKISVVGTAATRWKRHIDAYLHPGTSMKDREIHLKECLKYPDYVYEGVDYKSGVQLTLPPQHPIFYSHNPGYLWYNPPNTVMGDKSIFGLIYDFGLLTSQDIMVKGPPYDSDKYKVDPAFQVQGFENYEYWGRTHTKYSREMARAKSIKKDAEDYDKEEANRICAYYRTELYGAPSFQEKTKDLQRVLEEAAAIYQVVYKKAVTEIHLGKTPRVSFAWSVAGEALAFMYAEKRDPMIWSKAAYDEIHKRSTYRRTLS